MTRLRKRKRPLIALLGTAALTLTAGTNRVSGHGVGEHGVGEHS